MNDTELIHKIQSNKKYQNNEDLLEPILELVNNRLNGIRDSIKDNSVLESYCEKIISKSIIDILKSNNRISKKIDKSNQKIDYKNFKYSKTMPLNNSINLNCLKKIYTNFINQEIGNNLSFLDTIKLSMNDTNWIQKIKEETQLAQEDIIKILFELSEYTHKVVQE